MKVLRAEKPLKKLPAWWRWLKKIIRNHYQGKVSFKFKSNLSNLILHLSWHYTSFCYSFIFFSPHLKIALAIQKLPFSSTLCFLVRSQLSTDQTNWPQASAKTFQCLQPFSRREKETRAVFIAPMWASNFKKRLVQSSEHSLFLLPSLGARGTQHF